jgi:VanZ family protein
LKKKSLFLVAAISFTVLMELLLCLPGSTLPSGGVFSLPQLDKFIHIFLFGGFTGLWCYFFYKTSHDACQLAKIFFYVFLVAAVNGIAIEFIQKYFIPYRSFDQGDIIADLLASSIAYGLCNIKLLKIS